MDKRLKSLMEQLGQAINHSLSDSDQIAEVITRIKDGRYDVFLVLEATVGFNERDHAAEPAAALRRRFSGHVPGCDVSQVPAHQGR